ncbi:hypothetical protein RND81_01G001100 [Saponaria officinalis]|uniref:Signal peptidase complex catalytic subunit SEC11 n=1 Tax=Saponaria officinalis TaxID=3572 RepID=A0AAW1NAL4_SAPOF
MKLGECKMYWYVCAQQTQMLKHLKKSICEVPVRNTATQVIALGTIVAVALIIWNSLVLITGCESPIVVVLTGSMEPGFKRGDILFLNLNKTPFRAGDIVVFKIKEKEIPIVHRVTKVHKRRNSDEVNLLTKGDNNEMDDSYGIYADDQLWLENSHITGRVKGYLPYVGYATILMTEQPLIKYLLVGGLSLLTIISS